MDEPIELDEPIECDFCDVESPPMIWTGPEGENYCEACLKQKHPDGYRMDERH
jgi:hypothetical protein